MSLQSIRNAIVDVLGTVVEIKTVVKTPKQKLVGPLPLVVVLYAGFSQSPAAVKTTQTVYSFDVDLYLPAKNMDQAYEDLLELVPRVLEAFRKNPGLSQTCYYSIVESGTPFFNDAVEQPHVGHSFRIEVRKIEGKGGR